MAHKRRKLGEILQHWGVIDSQQFAEAMKIAQGSRKRLGEVLADLDYASENDVAKALASQFDMEFVDLDQADAVAKENLDLIPTDLIKKYLVLPLGKEGNKLKVLVHDPMDLALVDDLRFRLGSEIELALGSRTRIKDYIDNMLSETKASIDQLTRDLSVDHSVDRGQSLDMSIDRGQSIDVDGEGESEKGAMSREAERAPIVRLVKQIIEDAVHARASDIHIEPFEKRVRLRYRIDGVCHERDNIPKRTQASVIARLKIMSGMKVEERRIPQDGRIKMRMGGSQVDFRVAACPAYHGESIVLRILRPTRRKSASRTWGCRKTRSKPSTTSFVGPTASSSSPGPRARVRPPRSTRRSDELNRPDKKIITAEDPIEYNFKGINQCQVNNSIGFGFAQILRSMLRQAPNIILVGEIRDKEVGEVAVQAALTGHLVFSTLHTNDAPSAITRLVDMGVKPFLVASSIQAVLAQRLVRTLCKHCKEPDDHPSRRLMRLAGMTDQDIEGHTLYKAEGCNRCSYTGYRGRRGIYELMIMNSELRELAFNRAPLSKLRHAAEASGMRNLLGDARLKVLDGTTTLEEVSRFAQVGELVDTGEDEESFTVSPQEAS